MGKKRSLIVKLVSVSDMMNLFGKVCSEVFEIIMNMIKLFLNIVIVLGN